MAGWGKQGSYVPFLRVSRRNAILRPASVLAAWRELLLVEADVLEAAATARGDHRWAIVCDLLRRAADLLR